MKLKCVGINENGRGAQDVEFNDPATGKLFATIRLPGNMSGAFKADATYDLSFSTGSDAPAIAGVPDAEKPDPTKIGGLVKVT